MPVIDMSDETMNALRRQIALRLVAQRQHVPSLRDMIDEEDEGRKALLEIDDIIIGRA